MSDDDFSLQMKALSERVAALEGEIDQWRAIFDAVQDPMFQHDAEFRIVRANAAYLQRVGLPETQVLGRAYWEVFPPGSEPLPHCRGAIETPGLTSSNDRFTLAGGETFVSQGYLMQDQQGRAVGGLHILVDVTESERTSAELKRTTERYLRAVNGTNDGIWDWNLQTGEVFLSDRWKTLLGYRPDEVQDKFSTFESHIHPEDHDRVMGNLQECLQNVRPFRSELRLRTKNGEYRWFYGRGDVMLDDAGKPCCMAGGMMDITERKEVEQALERSESRYRILFETMESGVLIQDADSRIISANLAARRILGLSHDELLNRDSYHGEWDIVDEDGAPFAPEAHPTATVLRSGEPVRGVVMGVRNALDEKVHWLLVNAAPLHWRDSGEPTQVFAVFDEITRQVDAEHRAQRLSRTYQVQSACNRNVVDAASEQALFDGFCRDLVEVGGYAFAWIGLRVPDGHPDVTPVAQAGDHGSFLAKLFEELGQGTIGNRPFGRAMHENRPYVARDLIGDPDFEPWVNDASAHGFRSGIALPFHYEGEVIGALAIYASEVDAMDDTEVQLLQELVNDLSFGITILRGKARRTKAEAALQLSTRAIDAAVNGIMITDASQPGNPLIYVNPAFSAITGFEREEVIGRSLEFLHGSEREQPELELIKQAIAQQRERSVLLRNFRKDGSLFWNELHISPVRDADGAVRHYVGVMNDVTDHKRFEEEIKYHASHDELTGLPNRSLLMDRLEQTIRYAQRHENMVAVMLLDLDRFSMVNDALGHHLGDDVLRLVAGRLRDCAREADSVARYGSDEFVVVIPDLEQLEDLAKVNSRILAAIARPLQVGERELQLTCSIGVSLYPRDGDLNDTLVRNASAAMHRAKDTGRNTVQYYTTGLNARMMEKVMLTSQLRQAMERVEMVLHFQPQVDMATGAVRGVEALVRWQHPELGMVPPGQFIPIAEETGLIVPLGEWVLREACRQARAWENAGLDPLLMAVNVSALQLKNPEFVQLVAQVLLETGIKPQHLELELTESALVDNPEQIGARLRELKSLGVMLSIDDFGTGYSSLSYLSRFPFDKLKIDQSFVCDITDSPQDASIALTIVAMAHGLRMRVIAEGVESEAQLRLLQRYGCDELQGYLFSRPIPANDLEAMVRDGQGRPDLQFRSDDGESRQTLLVLDDEQNVTRALVRLLRAERYRVLSANNAHEAFQLLAIHNVQVVISDQRMPDISGTEFLSRVKELYPDTVRMVLSAYTDLDLVVAAVNRGWIYKFITKPWDPEGLKQEINDAFGQYQRQVGGRS